MKIRTLKTRFVFGRCTRFSPLFCSFDTLGYHFVKLDEYLALSHSLFKFYGEFTLNTPSVKTASKHASTSDFGGVNWGPYFGEKAYGNS